MLAPMPPRTLAKDPENGVPTRTELIRARPRSKPEDTVLDLQRTVGNRATTAIMRGPTKTKAKAPKKPTGTPCAVDADGTIRSEDGATVIGFRDADGNAFVTPGGKAPADARLGRLETPDGTVNVVVRVEEVTLEEIDGVTRYTRKKKGRSLGVLWAAPKLDGVVMRGGEPVAAADMPAAVKDKVKLGTRLSLEGQQSTIWRLLEFPSKDRKTLTPTWVQSNHDRKEYETRKGEIKKEIANLPSDLASGVEDDLEIMAMVSIIEGPWRSKSPSWDKMASLGVFQWGATKATTAKTSSSLGQFYVGLQSRADASAKKAEKDRTDTDRFYIDTWKQATDAGLSISGGNLRIGGNDATGGEVETALATPMGSGKLRAYQLQAAKDWLDDLRGKVARPLTYGDTLLHKGFSQSGPTIKSGGRTIKLGPPSTATTVGQVCTSKKAMALMANLLVNRPAWVNTVVWRALAPKDADTKAAELVDRLIAAQDAAEAKTAAEAAEAEAAAAAAAPPPAPGKKPKAKPKPKAKAKAKPEITAANAADPAAYKALQELVWPAKTASLAQTDLVERLYTISLEMYRIEKTTPTAETRAKRLVTTEVID
jgi:hypothetical protein